MIKADGLAAVQPAAGRLAEDYGVPRQAVEHLLGRYGTLAVEVLDLIRSDAGLANVRGRVVVVGGRGPSGARNDVAELVPADAPPSAVPRAWAISLLL